uniref:PCI domain-containing protein n=1 Tax=Chromera velia CCMP2878 TaxID=1169474 RepID=A0A0G4FUV6_9ALVE|mmetsp:Transcript_56126/g.109872  ORF Transcript_56126/g.109872 Transcript_56126/m.109872 type:complete len:387 (-) Transcript_56126:193-1353(-)|eukprot:Cvel_18813.t1-p1 / transcript=Cvel_18813.t1 / gene=Cvel_18813 / organism=Chromera_velia_CCMP2878 / gene_product=26S proteasome non-ATPase regulatory subunit 13, putative / transcript_product=26S proteasome non-ATPase regulatory subunit 13, putative / location=Cvel_scaffold1580:9018-13757(-) / protein_length=386 / sequence_SO=supercontig / SO=protein_coding / is_pseudo=false
MEVERSPIAQLQAEREAHASMTDKIDAMQDAFDKKLYHELTNLMLDYLKSQEVYGLPETRFFLENFVKSFKAKLNQVRVVDLVRLASESQASPEDAVRLLDAWEPSGNDEATMMWGAVKALFLIKLGRLPEAVELLESTEKLMSAKLGLDVNVKAAFHNALATLKKARGELEEYYKNSLLFLAYSPLDAIPETERPKLAYNIAVAAVAAPEIFNFGELLQQALLESLKGSEQEWILVILRAFNRGELKEFEKAVQETSAKLKQSELKDIVNTEMLHKAKLLALIEAAFRKPKTQRKLTFAEISQCSNVSNKEVEFLLMKAMSAGLLKGRINEVKQEVQVTWVRPRILDTQRLEVMEKRLMTWADEAKALALRLEDSAEPEAEALAA